VLGSCDEAVCCIKITASVNALDFIPYRCFRKVTSRNQQQLLEVIFSKPSSWKSSSLWIVVHTRTPLSPRWLESALYSLQVHPESLSFHLSAGISWPISTLQLMSRIQLWYIYLFSIAYVPEHLTPFTFGHSRQVAVLTNAYSSSSFRIDVFWPIFSEAKELCSNNTSK